MRKLLAIASLAMLAGCGDGYYIPDDVGEGPYPRGTCFSFTKAEAAAKSKTWTSDSGFSFIIWVKPENLKPVACK